jgi:hypothetical protein
LPIYRFALAASSTRRRIQRARNDELDSAGEEAVPMNEATQRAYEELADQHERKGEARQRDIFLVLAADAALSGGRRDDAERLRARLLKLSPHHLLRPYPSFAEALKSTDIQDYLADLRRQFPPQAGDPLVFKMKEPLERPPPPRGRPASKSPYEMAAPLAPPPVASEPTGGWFATLLFLLVLAAALALAAWTLVVPML